MNDLTTEQGKVDYIGKDSEKLIFTISIYDVQMNALEKLGRFLTEEELKITEKGLGWGLLTSIDTIYHAIFFEMM
jgi:hypothetical protein